MAKGCMAQIMTQGNSLHQLFIQAQCLRYSSRILGNLQRMRQPCSVMVAFRRQKYLCFVLQPAERFAM